MIFATLVFLAALALEGIGTWVSVIGLSALFAGSPIVITLAVCLDVAKLVTVSFLYKHWRSINWLMKSYMTVAACVLMFITSVGAFGFLSAEFQKSISSTNSQNVLITSLTEEQTRLQARKIEIDRQIAQLPERSVRGRTTLMRQFGPEIKRINDRLAQIDKELPQLKIDTIKKNVEVGPIIYVADAFSTTPEKAVKWIILVIIFVFDPLAVALLLAGNFLLANRGAQPPPDSEPAPEPEPEPAPEPEPESDPKPEPESVTPKEESSHELHSTQLYPDTSSSLSGSSVGSETPGALNPPAAESPVVEVEAPVISPEPPPKVKTEPPKQPRRQREVITIDQLKSGTPQKSSLEDLADTKGDVEMWATDSRKSDSKINRLYSESAVTVGGPSGKPSK